MPARMLNVARFSAVLIVFVASVAGVAWTTASAERRIGAREFEERQAAEAMLDALLARESALRGYSESAGEGFLAAYDEATAALAAAADKARRLAGERDSDERSAIAEQERLAERWSGVANDTVIRIRNRRPIPAESTATRTDLVERFERANDSLLDLIADESADAHAGAVERAVLVIVLLSAAFAATGALLLVRMRRLEVYRQLAEAQYYSSQREFAETLQVTQNEGEAHALLKRHLERSVADARVVVLNRNNSRDRLEAATTVHPSSPLARALVDSSPSSCLAVRLGRRTPRRRRTRCSRAGSAAATSGRRASRCWSAAR